MRISQRFALGTVLALVCGTAMARVIYVNGSAAPAAADGQTWATALKTVGQGVNAAQAGDEVWVAAGEYRELVYLKEGVGLYGGFVGLETSRSQRLGVPGLTVLSASYRHCVVTMPASDTVSADTVLDGFTVRDGTALGQGGAGIVVAAGAPTIAHNVIVNNACVVSKMVGGGIYCAAGSRPLIAGNIITANSGDSGAGIYVNNASPTVVNNTITGNSGLSGGGLCVIGPTSGVYANNIIAFNLTGVSIEQPGADFRSNCVYGNEWGDFAGDPAYMDPSRTLNADPRLASYATGNMHIQPASPCRNAGDDSAGGLLDVDLQPRRMGDHVDIGADESDGRIWTATTSIVRVRSDGDDANDGSSWGLAKRTVSAALAAAALRGGGEVWVAAGSYPAPWVSGQPTEAMPWVLPPFVYLYGGFAGTETERSQRNMPASPTVVSPGKHAALACLTGQHQSAADGFIFLNSANYANPSALISTIACLGGSPTLVNNVMAGNLGAVRLYGSAAVIDDNVILGNWPSSASGAAIDCEASTPTLTHNVIAENGASGPIAAPGAIGLTRCPSAVIANNVFRGNRASDAGKGSVLTAVESTALLANNTLVYNSGTSVYADAASLITLANNVFTSSPTPAGGPSLAPFRCYANCLDRSYYTTTPPAPFSSTQGNFLAYPLYADFAEEDFRLGPGSACIDAGDDRFAWPGEVDLDGMPRVQGRGVDVGAYESSHPGSSRSWPDVARILRMAGGLSAAMDPGVLEGDQQAGLTVADAIAIARWLLANPAR